jgi:hypothetical protein
VNFVSTASLVVPGISFTITLSFQTIALIKLDLPTFGLPAKAKLTTESSKVSNL